MERRAWGYDLPFSQYMHDALNRRGQLVPALYTANHAFEKSAVAALHPLYYDFPEEEGAYAHKDTYAFCDGLIVREPTYLTLPLH